MASFFLISIAITLVHDQCLYRVIEKVGAQPEGGHTRSYLLQFNQKSTWTFEEKINSIG